MTSQWRNILKPSGLSITPAEILALEEEVGFQFPWDYRDFLSTFNGGRVFLEHKLFVDERFYIGLSFLDPVSQGLPGIGVKEGRQIQWQEMLCLRQAVTI